MTDSRIEKWRGWIEGRIKDEVLALHSHRRVFREVTELATDADLPESMFWGYLQDTYAVTQAVAVRRLAEVNPRVVSLGQLIHEVSGDAERFTREFWIGMFSDELDQLGERGWEEQYAGEISEHLDPAIPAADVDALREGAEKVSGYVDRHLAHSDVDPVPVLPKFSDLDQAIDTVGMLFKKYANLLTASSWAMLEPEPQYDWLAIFRRPWISE